MSTRTKSKRNYSSLKLEETMQMLGHKNLIDWQLNAPPRSPSSILMTNLQRLRVFDLLNSEQAKTLLIDALFAEIVSEHPKLKIWKSEALDTDTLRGVADYLFAPYMAYLSTPLLCVTEAKRDDFDKGRVQCLAEMNACQWNNRKRGLEVVVYGIVSNGQGWQFYKLTLDCEAYMTTMYGFEDLPGVLGALDYLCTECAKNVPADCVR